MQNQLYTTHIKIALYINFALKLLHCKQKRLERIFSGSSTCLIQFLDKNQTDKILEVELKQANLTISCHINNKKRCSALFLFPDASELVNYASYFNTHYAYDFQKKYWILPNGYICIHKGTYSQGFYLYT
ncbi:hypothetical protein [Apibacter sp. HY039]|uniref:hypothetical protein n=1 Tax=Apibacter sp. HY039 TaxID=2501476 RepID=UPI000FEBDAB5|nr:hypothetical protein [Apibacter sp. HY039]